MPRPQRSRSAFRIKVGPRKDLRVPLRKQTEARFAAMMKGDIPIRIGTDNHMSWVETYRCPATPVHARLVGKMRRRKVVRGYPMKDGKSGAVSKPWRPSLW